MSPPLAGVAGEGPAFNHPRRRPPSVRLCAMCGHLSRAGTCLAPEAMVGWPARDVWPTCEGRWKIPREYPYAGR